MQKGASKLSILQGEQLQIRRFARFFSGEELDFVPKKKGAFSLVGPSKNMDICKTCRVERIVEKELARTVCPRCGDLKNFASHIFTSTDSESYNHRPKKPHHQSIAHMQKFLAQYSDAYEGTPIDIFATLYSKYMSIHSHDPQKATSTRTRQFLVEEGCGPVFSKFGDRILREIRGEPVPEYSTTQINFLLEQRLKMANNSENEEIEDEKENNSFGNQIYTRFIGKMNGMEQSRLFPQAKTNEIHQRRIRQLRKHFEHQKKSNIYMYSKDLQKRSAEENIEGTNKKRKITQWDIPPCD
jgi:Fe-S cluster biosynthesis and repair protein YggX